MKFIYKKIMTLGLFFGLGGLNAQVATSYTFSSNNGTFTPITGGTVVGTPTADDSSYGPYNFGFTFMYNGVCYDQFSFGSNGWFAFGSSVASDDYNMLSAGSSDNVISVFNADIQLGSNYSSTLTVGSPTALVSTTVGLAPGVVISSGYGFPASTTIIAVGANSFTASANATGTSNPVRFMNGEMRYETLGSAPNRTCVAQWLNSRKFGSGTGRDDNFNFQIRLEETTNRITISYGYMVNNTSSETMEVGLRGASIADFNNRTTTTNWSATTSGTVNTDACAVNNTLTPSNGLQFIWNTNVNANPTVAVSVTGNTVGCTGSALSNTLTASGANTYTWTNGAVVSNSITPTTTATTIYTVVGTATNNCIDTKTLAISIVPSPTISVNSGSICAGNSFTLTPTGATSYTYEGGNSVVSPTASVTYSVVGANAAGCISNIVASSVTVNALPTVSVVTSNSIICGPPFQGTATLNASGASTYLWNTSASGATLAVTPSVTTNYTVVGTDANGCSNSAVITQSVSTCTGINGLNPLLSGVSLYPNPNNGIFTLELPVDAKIEIVNVLGQIIISENMTFGKHIIDLNMHNNGVYLIQLNASGEKATFRIIKN